tara:strand:- start:27 stop:272 length:246 start_codon:yes stop_codon:yes gene_type:complete
MKCDREIVMRHNNPLRQNPENSGGLKGGSFNTCGMDLAERPQERPNNPFIKEVINSEFQNKTQGRQHNPSVKIFQREIISN